MSDEGIATTPRSSLLHAVRHAEVVKPGRDSLTQFEPFIYLPVEARDALVAAIEAAAELSQFLGTGGDPDLRHRVARLDVTLEALS